MERWSLYYDGAPMMIYFNDALGKDEPKAKLF